GTLGIITEVVLKLVPAQRPPTTLVASFPTLSGATDAVLEISRTTRPSMLEFMDRATINAVEAATRMGLDTSAAGMLVVQSDEHAADAAAEIAAIERICESFGATECYSTDVPEEADAFVEARRQAIPAVERTGT